MNVKDIKVLLRKENPLVLEVGADVGGDTGIFLQEFKDIKLYCSEPDPRYTEIFKNTINDERRTLIEAAVSNFDGKTILHLSKSNRININMRDINMRAVINLARAIKQSLRQIVFKKYNDSLGQASIKKLFQNQKFIHG
jgi:hypothetical protein